MRSADERSPTWGVIRAVVWGPTGRMFVVGLLATLAGVVGLVRTVLLRAPTEAGVVWMQVGALVVGIGFDVVVYLDAQRYLRSRRDDRR